MSRSPKPCTSCGGSKEPGKGKRYCNSCLAEKKCPKCEEFMVLTFRTSKWGKPTPEYKCRKCRTDSESKRRLQDLDAYYLAKVESKYGITKEQYFLLYEEACGACQVCGTVPTGKGPYRSLNVDHDHATGKVRGLLCAACNKALGYARDNPQILRKLANYLEGVQWIT